MTRPVTLLFVDDEPSILTAIRRVLSRTNFEVLTETDPFKALERLRREPVDVLVSDVDMPGMDGFALVARARQEFPSILRVLLTATSTEERVLRAINEGEVCRFFVKPFDTASFSAAIAALADRIDRDRRARVEDASTERRAAIEAWATTRHPKLLDLTRTDDGAIVVDVASARDCLDRYRARPPMVR
jgi:CheY-like chemotaxis protein